MEIDLVNPEYELLDPCPDIHALFLEYNTRFFQGKLLCCEVKWSPRMTTCAGVCSYEGRSGFCSIRLSKPLLTLRPRKDLVETLLHEMIHAFLFITANNRDRDGHGSEFQFHMHRINKLAGTNITIYHTFHAEVAVYKTHWWRCDGPCQHQKPFFGFVKRASNRAPGPNDRWWGAHASSCNGTFVKIKEPEGYGQKTSKADRTLSTQQSQKIEKTSKSKNINTLDNWIKGKDKSMIDMNNTGNSLLISPSQVPIENVGPSPSKESRSTSINVFMGSGTKLGGSSSISSLLSRWDTGVNKLKETSKTVNKKEEIEIIDLTQPTLPLPRKKPNPSMPTECITIQDTVDCPACFRKISPNAINSHLDTCLQ